MVAFFAALLLITGLAVGVVAAFATPQLRAGSPVLTNRGERLARSWSRWLGPVTRVVTPVLRPVAQGLRPVTQGMGRALRPLVRGLRPKVAPLTQAISQAVEEGSAPSVVRR